MVKKFTIPFASQGDANDIPDALQVDGKVSFTQGFGYDYERPYDDPQAKDIAREDMNGLFKAITSAVGELQTLGASEWSNAISYPKGAIVYYEKDLYISQVDDNQNTPPQNWVSITSIASDSLKKVANLSDLTNKATARNNLGLGSSATLNKTDVLGTSTSLVATQKLVNDTKINLENSKQDKLEFVGSGKVLREGAYGVGGTLECPSIFPKNSGFYRINGNEEVEGITPYGSLISCSYGEDHINSLYIPNYGVNPAVIIRGQSKEIVRIYGETNTSTDSSGFLRASGSKETFTKDLVSQSTGSSTTSVMSQKAVTDQLNAIKSGHGLGYGQQWVDVTSQRVAGTTYTNNTGKPIMIMIMFEDGENGTGSVYVNGSKVVDAWNNNSVDFPRSTTSIVIPPFSSYRATVEGVVKIHAWSELR